MKTHNEKIGYGILQAFYNNNKEYIGFRKLKEKTGHSSDAIRYWLNYLQKLHLIGQIESVNHRNRKYYLVSNETKAKNKQEVLELLIDSRRKRQKFNDNITAKKYKRKPSKREIEIIRRNKVKFHLMYLAGSGVTFEEVLSENRKRGTVAAIPFTSTNEVLLNTVKGIATEDFSSKHALSPLTYYHLHELKFKRSEIRECIEELVNEGMLKTVYNSKRHEYRYQIVDPLLQKIIYYDRNDISSLLGYLLEKIRLKWQWRNPLKKEIDSYEFLTSNQTKNTVRSYYTEIKENNNKRGLKNNTDDERVKYLDKKINQIWKDILRNYEDVKDKYPYSLVLGNSYFCL